MLPQSPSAKGKGKGKAADKLVSKPVTFTGFKQAPELASFVNKIRDGALYDIKVEHTVSVVFKDPAVADKLVNRYGAAGVPFEGQQLAVKYREGSDQVAVPSSIAIPLAHYGATRVLRLSRRKNIPGADLTPEDVYTLGSTDSVILKMYKPALPEHVTLHAIVVEFSSISGCVAVVNKVTQGMAGSKFANWNATYGPDPCDARRDAPIPSSASTTPLKPSAPAIFKGQQAGSRARSAPSAPKSSETKPPQEPIGDLIEFSSSGSEVGKGTESAEGGGKLKSKDDEKKGGLAGSKWAS